MPSSVKPMTNWQPQACAIIVRNGFKSFAQDKANYLAIAEVNPGEPLAYYMGAGWSGSENFQKEDDWVNAVQRECNRLEKPLVVK